MHCPHGPRKQSANSRGFTAVAFDEMNGPAATSARPIRSSPAGLGDATGHLLAPGDRRQEASCCSAGSASPLPSMATPRPRSGSSPFDVIPRNHHVGKEWTILEKGLKQRVRALNMFLRDIYHARRRVPHDSDDLIFHNLVFRPRRTARTSRTTSRHRDIVRVDPENFYVLEDMSYALGVSYMLKTNHYGDLPVRPPPRRACKVPGRTAAPANSLCPHAIRCSQPAAVGGPAVRRGRADRPPTTGVVFADHQALVPGRQARHRAAEGRYLTVKNDEVFNAHDRGPASTVIYRRVDHHFLHRFRRISRSACPGDVGDAAGNITSFANVVGTGSPTSRRSISTAADREILSR